MSVEVKEKEFIYELYSDRIRDVSEYRAINKLRKMIKKDKQLDKLQKTILDSKIEFKLGHYYSWLHWSGDKDEFCYYFDYKFNKGYGFRVINRLTKKKITAGTYVYMLREYMLMVKNHYESVSSRTSDRHYKHVLARGKKGAKGVNKHILYLRDKIREAEKKNDDGKSLYRVAEEILDDQELGTNDKDNILVDVYFLLGHFSPYEVHMNSEDKDSVGYNWLLIYNEGNGYFYKHKKTGKKLSPKDFLDMVTKYCEGVFNHYNKVYIEKTGVVW